MENRLINIEDIEIGDEILTLTQQSKYLKVMELPRKSKVPYAWRTDVDRYVAVKCKVNLTLVQKYGYKWDGTLKKSINCQYDDKVYNMEAPREDSPVEKFDLNFKPIWLVKREKI